MNRNISKKIATVFIVTLLFSVIAFFYRIQIYSFLYKIWPLFSIAIYIIVFRLMRSTKNRLYSYVIFLLLYSFISLILSAHYNYDLLHNILVSNTFFLPYICIAFAFIEYDKSVIEYISKYTVVPIVLFFIIVYIYRENLVFEDARLQLSTLNEARFSLDIVCKSFCFCCFPFLFLMPYTNKNKSIIIVTGFCLAMLFSIFFGRRNMILTTVVTLFLFLYNILSSKTIKNNFLKFFILLLILFCVVWGFSIAKSIVSGNNDMVFFEHLSRRYSSDSRGGILESFYNRMNENPLSWIFGLGIDSSYYDLELGQRSIVEAGVLHIIMKIGIIGFAGILILLFSAIRHTKNGNIFLVACRYFIIICLIETLYAGVPTFQLQWVLLWMCVGACHSHSIQELSNEEIIALLK